MPNTCTIAQGSWRRKCLIILMFVLFLFAILDEHNGNIGHVAKAI